MVVSVYLWPVDFCSSLALFQFSYKIFRSHKLFETQHIEILSCINLQLEEITIRVSMNAL